MPQKRVRRAAGSTYGQLVDRQAGGVGGDDRVRRDVRRDLAVKVFLPVHLLGDGLDDEVAALELVEVLVVVGGVDLGDAVLGAERRRFQLPQAVDAPS